MKTYDTRKKESLDEIVYYDGDPLFRFIEVNLLGFCNRKCSFCPVTKKPQKTYMSYEIFDKITNELQALNFNGLFIISGFSEPLLHPELYSFLDVLNTKIPDAKVMLNTNGDYLDKNIDIVEKLDYLFISVYDDESKYNYFNNIKNELNTDKIYLKKRYLGFDKNNRGGFFNSEKVLPIEKPCFYPFYLIDVNWNGNIMFCPNSFLEENVIGNIEDVTLLEAWKCEKINNLRYNMMKNKRIYPCSKCDVSGDIVGENYYEAWEKSKIFKNNI